MFQKIILFAIFSTLASAPSFGHSGPDHDHLTGAKKTPVSGGLTGNGQWTYRAEVGWDDFPDGQEMGQTHGGVVVDPQSGLVYASTNTKKGILVFKPDGGYLKSIASETQGLHAMDVTVEEGETILWGAQLGGPNPLRVCKLDTNGKLLMAISAEQYPDLEGGWKGLTSVAVAPDGSIFCSMGYGSQKIHKFDAEGKLLKSFGGSGKGQAVKTKRCHGLKVDLRFGEPRLLVCDRENRRLFHTTLEGEWLGEYATRLRRPCSVAIIGDFCAVAELEARVTILDKKGTPVAFLGDHPVRKNWANFRADLKEIPAHLFTAPHGIAFDAVGNLYVEDWNVAGRVTKLTRLREFKNKK